jgi:hypothetical protein
MNDLGTRLQNCKVFPKRSKACRVFELMDDIGFLFSTASLYRGCYPGRGRSTARGLPMSAGSKKDCPLESVERFKQGFDALANEAHRRAEANP